MRKLLDCQHCDEAGRKVQRLANALAAGLPVLDGVVLLPEEPLPTAAELSAALCGISDEDAAPPVTEEPRFVVRSSAQAEDQLGRSAAGLFLSLTNVPLDGVRAAAAEVRASGRSSLILDYCGQHVPVAVLIQPMVQADRLGVLFLRPDGSADIEDRPAHAPEWSDVCPGHLPTDDSSALLQGARQLAALLDTEAERSAEAAYIEYATRANGNVVFLQVRPAARPLSETTWPGPNFPDAHTLTFSLDREHNPDPLSAAQAALVDGVADLVPSLRQCVLQGFLYYASLPATLLRPEQAGTAPLLSRPADLEHHFYSELLPACEALLQPLESLLLDQDGALAPRLLAAPEQVAISMPEAWQAYREIYHRYVGQLSPVLKHARKRLDELLLTNLGETLAQHGALLSGVGNYQATRLQRLWELGRAGAPKPLLRSYLARYGACASAWDVAVPCDDEQPEQVRQVALRLSQSGQPPQLLHAQAEQPYLQQLQHLLTRLPASVGESLQVLVPQVRAALRVAEDDDALFFRAQRLLRWALLSHGAKLCQQGRLLQPSQIFDLPTDLVLLLLRDHAGPLQLTPPSSSSQSLDLLALAKVGAQQRRAARALLPPTQFVAGKPHWSQPAGRILSGYGLPGTISGPVRGRAQVIRTLDQPPQPAIPNDPSHEATILVLPVLLPSWAPSLWQAAALVTDSGGAFSHGAILARERGIPAVLATREATKTIQDGDELLVDGARGRVFILDPTRHDPAID